MLIDTLQARLAKRMQAKGLTVVELEKRAGLKRNVARNMLKGQSKRPNSRNLQAIAEVLDCCPTELMSSTAHSPPVCAHTNLQLFCQATEEVLKVFTLRQEAPPLDVLFSSVKEVYLYAIRRNPPAVDAHFALWFVERNFSE